MFSLRDYLEYKKIQSAFAEMKKKNAEIKNLTVRQPHIGPLKHIRFEPEKVVAPVNDLSYLSKPIHIPKTPTTRHITYPEVDKGEVHIGRIGYMRRIK